MTMGRKGFWIAGGLALLFAVAALSLRVLDRAGGERRSGAGSMTYGEAVIPEVAADPALEQRNVKDAIRRFPKDARLYRRLGNAFVEQGDLGAAEGAYQKAIQCDPADADSYLNLGNVYFLMSSERPEKIESAVRIYRTAVRLAPGDPEPHYNLAYALFAQGKTMEALGELERVLEMEPGHERAKDLKRRIRP